MNRISNEIRSINGAIILSNGEIAWLYESIPTILEKVRSEQWVVLGGDVYTYTENDTYSSWFFQPSPNMSMEVNVSNSIKKCLDFINQFTSRNGQEYLFVLVLSDSYISGVGTI